MKSKTIFLLQPSQALWNTNFGFSVSPSWQPYKPLSSKIHFVQLLGSFILSIKTVTTIGDEGKDLCWISLEKRFKICASVGFVCKTLNIDKMVSSYSSFLDIHLDFWFTSPVLPHLKNKKCSMVKTFISTATS